MARGGRVPAPEPDYADVAYEEEPDADFGDPDSRKTVVQYQQQQGGSPAPAGDDLVGSFGRMAISATSSGLWSRQGSAYDCDGGRLYPIFRRSDDVFRQWITGRCDAKTILRELGYGGADIVRPRPSLLQTNPKLPGAHHSDAPLVDLHIHIYHNNIGSLALGTDDRKGRKK